MPETIKSSLPVLALSANLLCPLPLLAGTVTYKYDALDRLTQVSYPEGTIVQYAYDPAGNRTQKLITNSDDIDSDGDGLANQQEIDIYGTDPFALDSDGDGLRDSVEVGIAGYDADPLTTTDPLDPDTDGDGYLDGNNGVDPCEDCDNNGITDGEETDPSAPDAFVHLIGGWNLFAYPAEVAAEHAACSGLVEVFGGFGAIESISRLNPSTGVFEQCDANGGVDFPVETGEGYFVRSYSDVAMVWPWSPACPVRLLQPGLNLVGYPAPMDLTCFRWLDAQVPGTVTSIQGYNPSTGRFESCALVDLDGSGPHTVGLDFPIRAAQGYLFHAMTQGEVVYPGCP